MRVREAAGGGLVLDVGDAGTGDAASDFGHPVETSQVVIERSGDMIDLDMVTEGGPELGVRLSPDWARRIGAALVALANQCDAEGSGRACAACGVRFLSGQSVDGVPVLGGHGHPVLCDRHHDRGKWAGSGIPAATLKADRS